MNDKKFVLSEEPVKRTIDGYEYLLYRIVATKSFSTPYRKINAGDFGGLVSSEENLSQDGNCWIFYDAIVVEDAFVRDNAMVCGSAVVADSALIKGNAFVSGESVISDFATVRDAAIVTGKSSVFGHALISDNAIVNDNAQVYGSACVSDSSKILNKATIHGSACVSGSSMISDNAVIGGFAQLKNVVVEDESSISAYAKIAAKKDNLIVISGKSNINSSITATFEEEISSFEIRDAIITVPSDLFTIPINYGYKNIFLVKYSSHCGKMVYNSSTDEISTAKEFKEECIKVFERYKSQNPGKYEIIEPFVDWLKDNVSSGITKFVPIINNLARRFEFCFPSVSIDKKTFPAFLVSSYLEAHLFMIPFLLGCDSKCSEILPTDCKKNLEQLATSIIEEGSLDIYTKKLVSLDNIVFINKPLMKEISNFYSVSETSGIEFSEIASMEDVVVLSA